MRGAPGVIGAQRRHREVAGPAGADRGSLIDAVRQSRHHVQPAGRRQRRGMAHVPLHRVSSAARRRAYSVRMRADMRRQQAQAHELRQDRLGERVGAAIGQGAQADEGRHQRRGHDGEPDAAAPGARVLLKVPQ